MDKKDIVAVVVAYNIDKEEIGLNINSYMNYVDKVIIVNNSDKKTNLDELINVEYISLGKNYGIAKALNVGCNWAIEHGYKYALTMDQDSKFKMNLIDEYKKIKNKDIIIYSPKYLISRKKNKKYRRDFIEIYWTMQSGCIFNLQLYKIVGCFREDFFIDCVDYEYCLRARKKGYKIIQCTKAELIHNPGIEKTKRILFWNYKYGYMSEKRLYYQIRNLSQIWKEYKCFKALLIILLKFLKILLLFDDKLLYFKYFRLARKDFKNNKFGEIKEEIDG